MTQKVRGSIISVTTVLMKDHTVQRNVSNMWAEDGDPDEHFQTVYGVTLQCMVKKE